MLPSSSPASFPFERMNASSCREDYEGLLVIDKLVLHSNTSPGLSHYLTGGPMAMELSKNPTVLVVNDTVFAHGGLLPEHGVTPVRYKG